MNEQQKIEETAVQSPEKGPEKSKARRIFDEIMSWVVPIVLAVALALFLNNYIIVNATVPTGSMENTIMTGTRLMGSRLAYRSSEPQRGDIIVFKFPCDESENYIKRLIGLPGETVEIKDGKIYIDGSTTPLEEDYLKEEWVIANDGFVFEVPKGHYLMLGDNRNNSLDSRYWADKALARGLADDMDEAMSYSFVARDKLLGKAMFTYYPKISKLSH